MDQKVKGKHIKKLRKYLFEIKGFKKIKVFKKKILEQPQILFKEFLKY